MVRQSATEDIFSPALRELPGPGLWGPASFREYIAEYGLAAPRQTQTYISVDHLGALPRSLREAGAMVLRLGDADGVGTQFGLVRTAGTLDSFFIHDAEHFSAAAVETFVPTSGVDQLFPFYLVGIMAEVNLLSYGFACGLLGTALQLDEPLRPISRAGGNGRQSFLLRPHSTLDVVVDHRCGQVETDALFVAARDGRQHLFVLEAKVGRSSRSLSKHKLLYPVLAVANRVPPDMPIVPVYVRIWNQPQGLTFCVAVCQAVHSDASPPALDELRVARVRIMRVPRILSGFTGA